jgi:hypothetical protein
LLTIREERGILEMLRCMDGVEVKELSYDGALVVFLDPTIIIEAIASYDP